jgi:hypothetical protein
MKFPVALAVLTVLWSPATHCAEERLMPVYDAAVAGDGVAAIAALSSIDSSALDSDEASRAACVRNTLLFSPQEDALSSMSNSILWAYRSYWQR